MADRTLTINHADGGSETYTLKTEDVLGVRNMQVDGETVTIDRTAPDLVRTIIADGQTITIDTTREGVRTLTVDGTEITIDRTEESNLDSFIQQFTGSSLILSLKDRASTSGNTIVVRVRRSSDNAEADFKSKEVFDGTLVAWVGAGNDGFVETWYDQSGNGNDATQQVSGSQPKIVDAGVFLGQVDFLNGVSTFLETNNSDLANLSELSLFSVLEPITASANEFAISAGSIVNSTGNYGGWALWANGYSDRLDFTTQARGSGTNSRARLNITSTSPVVYSATLNGTDAQASLNGVLGTENTSMITPYNSDATRRKLRLGCQYTFAPTSFYKGAMKELIIYPSDQSANRVAIETNINNQYDIY